MLKNGILLFSLLLLLLFYCCPGISNPDHPISAGVSVNLAHGESPVHVPAEFVVLLILKDIARRMRCGGPFHCCAGADNSPAKPAVAWRPPQPSGCRRPPSPISTTWWAPIRQLPRATYVCSRLVFFFGREILPHSTEPSTVQGKVFGRVLACIFAIIFLQLGGGGQ